MTALAMDVRELNADELDEVSGGVLGAVVVLGLVCLLAYSAYKAGEHDGYQDTKPSCN